MLRPSWRLPLYGCPRVAGFLQPTQAFLRLMAGKRTGPFSLSLGQRCLAFEITFGLSRRSITSFWPNWKRTGCGHRRLPTDAR
jgi:hypothetical protein